MSIAENYKHLRLEIPDNVAIVLAAKHRTTQEVAEAIEAGVVNIGENYVQEAGQMFSDLKKEAAKVKWHMIGHLQTNKINKTLRIFDVIQTVDSLEQAEAINNRVIKAKKQIMPVFIEINIGGEDTKAGIRPNEHEPFENYMENLIRDVSRFGSIRIEGLMTMGPRFGNPENLRPYFRRTRIIFDRIKCLNLPNVYLSRLIFSVFKTGAMLVWDKHVRLASCPRKPTWAWHPAVVLSAAKRKFSTASSINMKYLSMGMTNSYKVAIEEGSNMVRIGTAVFGERPFCED